MENAERNDQQQADKKSAGEKARSKSLTERLSAEHKVSLESPSQISTSQINPSQINPSQINPSQISATAGSNLDAPPSNMITALPPSSLSKISTGTSSERQSITQELNIDKNQAIQKNQISEKNQALQKNQALDTNQAREALKKKAREQTRHNHSFDCLPETRLYTGSSEYEPTGLAGQWQSSGDGELLGNTSRETEETFRKAAADNSTSPAQLAWLATLVSPEVRVSVAGNEKTPAETLRKLANDADNSVRLAVASNKTSPIDVLHSLARDSSKAVSIEAEAELAARGDHSELEKKSHELLANNRFNSTSNSLVASYTNLDALKLEPMGTQPGDEINRTEGWNALNSEGAQKAYIQQKDTVKDLKFNANNHGNGPRKPALPPMVLEPPKGASPEETLAFFRMLATKLSTPPTKLVELARHESMDVRAAVAENVSTPLEGFRILAEDNHSQVKLRVIDNSSCPLSIIEILAQDSDPYVAYEAKNQLKRLNPGHPYKSGSESRFL